MAQGLHTATQIIHTQTQNNIWIVFLCFPTTFCYGEEPEHFQAASGVVVQRNETLKDFKIGLSIFSVKGPFSHKHQEIGPLRNGFFSSIVFFDQISISEFKISYKTFLEPGKGVFCG